MTIQCPKCKGKNYNRVRNRTIKEYYTNGKFESRHNENIKWGYICRDCSQMWHYENRKIILSWS